MRLDLLVAEKAAVTRTRAQNLIKTGGVTLGGVTLNKPSFDLDPSSPIEITDTLKYVSLGGLKLENALRTCGISVKDKVCLDIGAANGGFTDCMLKSGARKVSAVDVTIAFPESLLSDPRVTIYDNTNVKDLLTVFQTGSFDFITVDLSFISLTGIFEIVAPLLTKDGVMMALFKPQFEVGRDKLPKSGVVHDPKLLEKTFRKFCASAQAVGLTYLADAPVPALFPEKNRERTVFFKA
ncbi:MAG: TlyA family RNA methyltransferase [Clostridia bacterium]|nr:TlyA family RNA methyltransferase [Clostridia bacterium]